MTFKVEQKKSDPNTPSFIRVEEELRKFILSVDKEIDRIFMENMEKNSQVIKSILMDFLKSKEDEIDSETHRLFLANKIFSLNQFNVRYKSDLLLREDNELVLEGRMREFVGEHFTNIVEKYIVYSNVQKTTNTTLSSIKESIGDIRKKVESDANFLSKNEIESQQGLIQSSLSKEGAISNIMFLFYVWLPSVAIIPREDHNSFYYTVRRWDQGVVPKEEFGCQCGFRSATEGEVLLSIQDNTSLGEGLDFQLNLLRERGVI